MNEQSRAKEYSWGEQEQDALGMAFSQVGIDAEWRIAGLFLNYSPSF